jgi:DNA-binding transcriptional MerR regulator
VTSYTSAEVCAMTGASYRQVDYWARHGFIAGQATGPGTGRQRRWTADQVETVARLVEASKLRTRWATPITS